MPAFGKPYKQRSPDEVRRRSGQYRPPDLKKRVERKKLDDEVFRLSEERRRDQEGKKPKPPKPKPPKSTMQRFKEGFTRAIGLGGVLDALDQNKNKKK